MAEGLIERIRVRAYEIWEGNGREGNPEEHWLAAEREILGDQAAPRESFSGDAAGREATRACGYCRLVRQYAKCYLSTSSSITHGNNY